MSEIETTQKVFITYKGSTEVYDGIAVAAVSSLESDQPNETMAETNTGKIDVSKVDFFLLGAMTRKHLLAMEVKFIQDTWHFWSDSEKTAIIDALSRLVSTDQSNQLSQEGNSINDGQS